MMEYIEEGDVGIDIQGTILDIIEDGAGAEENPGLRPLRELIQNADDAKSDRIAIRIDARELTFWNDGLTLTRDFPEEPYKGTFNAIRMIQGRSKKADKGTSGNYGSGFRSCHMFADEAEIMGKVRTPKGELGVVGVCNPYGLTIDYHSERYIEIETRDQKERPRRQVAVPEASRRKGVRFRFPWRVSIKPGIDVDQDWKKYLWNQKRIEKLAQDFLAEIPRILLGCRWVREAVLRVEIQGTKETRFWNRDFNIEELIAGGDSRREVRLEHLSVDKPPDDHVLLKLPTDNLQSMSTSVFLTFTHKAKSSEARFAKEAHQEPYCILIMPRSPSENMPSYTPIALTGDSGNAFGPLAFLPPHNSRTKIKLDFMDKETGAAQFGWAASALSMFCDVLLPEMFEESLRLAEDDADFDYEDLLRLLPRKRPDWWFSDSNMADQAGDMVRGWRKYREGVARTPIIPSGDSAVSADDAIVIRGFDEEESGLLGNYIGSLGRTVIRDTAVSILEGLGDWDDLGPLKLATEVGSALDFLEVIEHADVELGVDDLGEESVRRLIRTMIAKPSGKWKGDANREKIPIIPDADGILRPLREESGGFYFFEEVASLSGLLPNARMIHPDYVEELDGVKLGDINPTILAKFVDESVRSAPDKFGDLRTDDALWLQVSKAAAMIVTADDFVLSSVRDYSFLPCLHRGKVSVRGSSRVGDKVWGVDVRAGGAWFNFSRKEFIFFDSAENRESVGLHPKVIHNLTWLEMHPDIEQARREEMRGALRMHAVGEEGRVVNIYRSLIFGFNWLAEEINEDGKPGWGTDAVSLFQKHEDGAFEIDGWLEKKPTDKERDEILESLLDTLPKDSEDRPARIRGQWGATKKALSNLHLLKGADGEWHKLGDLCYELDPDLSELFEKTPVLKEHKEMLSYTVLTRDIGDGGLGITTRITEKEIIARLTSLKGFTPDNRKTRDRILGMMLESNEEWVLKDLLDMEWVPRAEGKATKPKHAILPTPEMKGLLGADHPSYVTVDVDHSSSDVRDRASEIGLIHNHEDPNDLLGALTGPESVWDGLTGFAIIESLTRAWKDKKDEVREDRTKTSRLPNSKGEWSDGTWLCDHSESADISSLFPEQNVCDREVLGSRDSMEMAQAWIVKDSVSGPSIDELLDRIRRKGGEDELEQLWGLLVAREALILDDDVPGDSGRIGVPIGNGQKAKVRDIVFVGPKSSEVVASQSITSLEILPSGDSKRGVLIKLGALDLESIDEAKLNQISRESLESGHRNLELQKLWLALAMAGIGDEELLKGPYWPLRSKVSEGAKTQPAIPQSKFKRQALFPMKDDPEERINRMITDPNGGVPMFLLPREGPLMERIYERLDADKKGLVPLLSRCHSRRVEGDSEGNPDPYLRKAIGNIMKGIGVLGIENIIHSSDVDVRLTKEAISGVLVVQLQPGGRWVTWKRDPRTPNVSASILDGKLSILVSTSQTNDRSEDDLIEAMVVALRPRRPKDTLRITGLIRTEEDNWNEINESLTGFSPNHERPLLEKAFYAKIRDDLGKLYDCCQFCKRQTPRNRSGELQEGVVSLFSKLGFYSTDRVPYDLGNSLYLCPVHKSLHHRSLINIPNLDKAIATIKSNPEKKEGAVEKLLSGTGSINWGVVSFERERGEGKMGDVTHEVEWRGKHAKAFRKTLAIYLEGL